MSAESELTRDKEGFLKCKECPKRFLTELMFENHSTNQHNKETGAKLNQTQHSQTIKDEIYFPNNSQTEETLCNSYFGIRVDLNLQSNEHPNTSHNNALSGNAALRNFSQIERLRVQAHTGFHPSTIPQS